MEEVQEECRDSGSLKAKALESSKVVKESYKDK